MSRILRMRKLFYAQNAVKGGAIRRKGGATPPPRFHPDAIFLRKLTAANSTEVSRVTPSTLARATSMRSK